MLVVLVVLAIVAFAVFYAWSDNREIRGMVEQSAAKRRRFEAWCADNDIDPLTRAAEEAYESMQRDNETLLRD